jgi:DNA polymerase-4
MLHPELRGKYIAVCGSTEDRQGIVLAKNQLAKKCGVKTGDVIWEAKQKCPQLTIVPPHMDQYLKFSKIVREIYMRYSSEGSGRISFAKRQRDMVCRCLVE